MEIQFPNLFGGLTFHIDNVAFRLFGIPIYWYGIIIAFGFALAVLLGTRVCKNFGISQEDVIDLVLFAIPSAIIGARAYYVIFSWSQFSENPIRIFNPRTGGLAIYGGVIGAFLAAYFVAKYKKISLLTLFDFGVPYLVLAQGIGRWGNFVNQEAYGSPTSLPWGMTGSIIGSEPVHPTFLYESLWCFAVFFFLIWYRKRTKVEGEVFFLYLILYGFGRMLIEGLRTDSLMLGNFRVSQLLSIVLVLTFSIVFYLRRKKIADNLEESFENVPSKYASVLESMKESSEDNSTDDVEEKVEEAEDGTKEVGEVMEDAEEAEDEKLEN